MHSHRHPFSPTTLTRRGFTAGATALAATVLASRHAAAQTPAPTGEIDFQGRIGRLLVALPARELDNASPLAFYYADLAGQLASIGVERPDPGARSVELPEGFFEGTIAIPLAARAYQSGLDPEWVSTFGFNPFAVGQVIELFDAPSVVSVFHGGFDRATVEAALEASGYAMVLQESGGAYWTFGDDLSPDTPVGRLGVGAMNHAIVSDDLLVFGSQEADVQAASQVLAGLAPSMLEQGVWADMMAHFSPDIVGLIPLAPGVLRNAALSDQPGATPVRERDDPEVEWLAFGVRSGSRAAPLTLVGEGTPEATPVSGIAPVPARVEVRIRYGSEEMAEREADAIPDRWQSSSSMLTMQPYSELMTVEDARVSERDPRVVAIDFTTDAPNQWSHLIHTVDLMPFVPTVG